MSTRLMAVGSQRDGKAEGNVLPFGTARSYSENRRDSSRAFPGTVTSELARALQTERRH
ncbi:hypothetical protein MHYP_G00137690 [Metynnis hypsauchen]